MSEGITVADAVARQIALAGTRYAFGHPGGEIVRLIDALERAGVRFVATHHEETAGFMAMGYGEYTGRPGVSLATLGPGAANALPGVAAAYLERAPVLALTATRDPGSSPRSAHQLLDLRALFGPISKGSFSLTAVDPTAEIAEAIATAQRARPGPVHVALSSEVAGTGVVGQTSGPGAPSLMDAGPAGVARPLLPDADALARARSLLAQSRRPCVIVGRGVVEPSRARSALAFVRALKAAAAVTPKAKGVIPEDDPLYCGTLESAADELVVEFLRQADVIVCLGVDSVEFAKPWRHEAPVIHVDDFRADGYYAPAVELLGDVVGGITALEAGTRRQPAWPTEAIAVHRADLRAHLEPAAGKLSPQHLVEAVRGALRRSAVATVDVGAHKLLVGQVWKAFAPHTFFVANGLSSMGYALPVAAAVRLAGARAPIVAFVGDGGLAMYLGEIETLVRLGLDLLIVVFADASLELIRLAQGREGLPEVGTTFANPEWPALGRAFGINVFECDSVGVLPGTVSRAVKAPGLRLLVAHIDQGAYPL